MESESVVSALNIEKGNSSKELSCNISNFFFFFISTAETTPHSHSYRALLCHVLL